MEMMIWMIMGMIMKNDYGDDDDDDEGYEEK